MTITRLHLENFQTIAQPTSIELSEVVMLFGPNSSGKSAVLDALKFVLPMCTHARGNKNDQNLRRYRFSKGERMVHREGDRHSRSILASCWRKYGELWASHLKVGVEGLVEIKDVDPLSFSWAWDFGWSLEEPDYGRYHHLDDILQFCNRTAMFSVDAEWLCHIASDRQDFGYDDSYLTLNLKHPALLQELQSALDSDFSWSQSGLAELTDMQEMVQRIQYLLRDNDWRDPVWIDEDGNLVCEGAWDISDNRVLRIVYEMYSQYGRKVNEARLLETKILETVFDRVNTLFELASNEAMPFVVEDSRTIPNPRELTYLMDAYSGLGSPVGKDIPDEYDMSSPTYRELAEGFCGKLPDYNNYSDRGLFENSQTLLDNVNRLMSDFMFVDRGYQLDRTCAYVITEQEARSLVTAAASDSINQAKIDGQCLIKLELRDVKGDRYDFDEVGSGIGYSLPVLVGLANDSGQVAIAQPELHLHPALQSAMGDAVLHSASSGHRILLETHSEHLLLRVLRRIRQASNELLDSTDYPSATAQKVRVYYFEPLMDGTTRVHKLRVSTEGEFLDPWPNGFFEERYEDLFDE